MNNVFLMFLSLSVSGGLLALLLFLLRPLVRNRISKTWQYYIYLVVILRLLLPLSPEQNLLNILRQTTAPVEYRIEDFSPANDEAPPFIIEGFQENAIPGEFLKNPQDPQQIAPTAPLLPNIQQWLWLLWLIPALLLFLRKIISYRRFIAKAKSGCTPVASKETAAIYQTACKSLNIRHAPALACNGNLPAPALLGILQPVIVLPDTAFDSRQLQYIFHHELTHYKRLDILYKWLVQTALCLHWFNPLVYWAGKEINRCCELSCDEAVIKSLDATGKHAYGNMLLDAIRPGGAMPYAPISITLNEDKALVKERLTAIMNYKKPSKIALGLSAFLALTFTLGAAFTGVYGNEPSSKAAPSGSAGNYEEPGIPNGSSQNSGLYAQNNNTQTDSHTFFLKEADYPGDRAQIVKTISGAGIKNINIDAQLCTLVLDYADADDFEVLFSYPEITKPNYDQYFTLNAGKENADTVAIATTYENPGGAHLFDPIDGFDDTLYPKASVLLVKVPQKHYDTLTLNLTAVNDGSLTMWVDAETLKIHNNAGNISVRAERQYDNLVIENDVGNLSFHIRHLGEEVNITNDIGFVSLQLPEDPEDIKLVMRGALTPVGITKPGEDTVYQRPGTYALPANWTPATAGDTLYFERGTGQNIITLVNSPNASFEIKLWERSPSIVIEDEITTISSGENTALREALTVHQSFHDTKAAKQFSEQVEKTGNYVHAMRIDVKDIYGYDHQAMVYICEGTDTYRKEFLDGLEKLKTAYAATTGPITGYMDLYWDNRIRNFGGIEYFAIEEVPLTTALNENCTGYIVMVSGSEEFAAPTKEFSRILWDQYDLLNQIRE